MAANRIGAGDNLVLFLALIPFVMDRGEVSVDEAARVFQRRPEDIRKAVELIACSGIPGESSAYLHADLFDIDWDLFLDEDIIRFEHTIVIDSQPGFSAREMSALIAGLQYLAQHPAWAGRSDLEGLLAKFAGSTSHLLVKGQAPDRVLSQLTQAVADRVQLEMVYVNKRGERDRRVVDPIAVDSRDDVWFLRAWCHTRRALRTFRVDRIEDISVTTTPADTHEDLLDPEVWSVFSPSTDDLVVTIEFAPQALSLITEYLDRSAPPEPHGENLRAEVRFAHQGSLVRFAAKFPTMVTVLGPEHARSAVRNWATSALERYVVPPASG